MLTTHNPRKIAALNDAARKSFSGCRVYMTPGVQALYQTQAIVARVQAFDDFTECNDPYGEHDFGSVEFCGETIFWRIEYYDLDFQMHSLDPSDPDITARVLTIMLGHEYCSATIEKRIQSSPIGADAHGAPAVLYAKPSRQNPRIRRQAWH